MFRRLRQLLQPKAPHPAAPSPPTNPPARAPAPRPPEPVRRRAAPTGPAAPEAHHELALYKYDDCSYCRRVLRALGSLPVLSVELRDTRQDPRHSQGLKALTGGTQVPCLVIDGAPMLESADIIRWLEAHAAWKAGQVNA